MSLRAANTGALKAAATSARGGRPVGCSIVETFAKDAAPRELEEVLRLEYRSKLLNPKWAQARRPASSLGHLEHSYLVCLADYVGQAFVAFRGFFVFSLSFLLNGVAD